MMIKEKKKNYIILFVCFLITGIAGFRLLSSGIGGYIGDLTYHLLRIESVKEALEAGSFPPRVNPIFLNGYGYGSSLFYPDIFLVIPALLNMMGITLLVSYKIFLFIIIFAASYTTYYSMRIFCGKYEWALLGSGVLILSNFYLADIHSRSGMSEMLACVFAPLLMAGIYDYFACEGKRVYLLGIAFGGMVLSHTIMTFIGVLITLSIFAGMLLVPTKRKLIFEKKRFGKLILTAFLTILVVGYYVFPMLEQMVNDRFWFNTPWAKVGKYVQTLESLFVPVGVFYYKARFGVGIPVLALLAGRIYLGKVKNKWADCLIALGVIQFIVMTDVLFWVMMQDTVMNMIQFPYRFYPYALFLIICGMMIVLAEKRENKQIGKGVMPILVLLTIVCGFWQMEYCYNYDERVSVDSDYVNSNTFLIGMGEWIPEGVTEEVFEGEGVDTVLAEDGANISLADIAYNKHSFEIKETNGRRYIVPLLYYKGYEAELILDNGERKAVTVSKSSDGLVQIDMNETTVGVIHVWYEGTTLQKMSTVVSLVGTMGIVLFTGVIRIKKKKNYHNIKTANKEMINT